MYKRQVEREEVYEQLDLFTDYEAQRKKQEEEAVSYTHLDVYKRQVYYNYWNSDRPAML